MRKKPLPNQLLEFQKVKKKKPLNRLDAGKQFLTNLIYMVPLPQVLKMIIPFYWNPGKSIIDVTAGERISWKAFPYNHISPCGFEHWHVDFNDIEEKTKADFHLPAQEIDRLDSKYDILFNDFPFTDKKNGLESFGTKRKNDKIRSERQKKVNRRDFYFNKFEDLETLFPKCVRAWNRTADNLIIKIGDSHKQKKLRKNHVHAIINFDHEFNNVSKFHLIDCIHYRGIYSSRGGRFPFAQSVTSYYLIFKKDVNSR